MLRLWNRHQNAAATHGHCPCQHRSDVLFLSHVTSLHHKSDWQSLGHGQNLHLSCERSIPRGETISGPSLPKPRAGAAGQLERMKNVHYFAFMGTSNSLWTWTPGISPQNFLCSLNHPGIKGKHIVSMLHDPAFLPISYTLSIPWIHLLLSRSTSITWIQDFLLRIFLNGLTHYSFVEI